MTNIHLTLKNLVLTAALALLSCAAVNLSAQNAITRVDVPFPFVANHIPLQAGHYEIISSDAGLKLVDATTGTGRAILLVHHECDNSPERRGRLTFEKSGNRFVLTEVRFTGSNVRSVLLAQPVRERVVAQGPSANGATIQLAMK